jgi:hypothetical protein
MEIVIGTLHQAQQEFFYYLTKSKTATTVLTRPPLPDYSKIIKELEMGTYHISKMPDSRARFVSTPKEANSSSAAAKSKATTGVDNLKPDLVLQKRYKDTGSPALSVTMASNADKIPKAGNHEMCLSWALQGKCHTNCPCKSNHRDIGINATSRLHNFLDLCNIGGARS